MEATIGTILTTIMGGGPQAIVAVLLVVIWFFFMERRRLLNIIVKKDDKIEKIVDDYARGNLSLADALNSLKNALGEIKSRL